jgi:hydrogenase-4 component B
VLPCAALIALLIVAVMWNHSATHRRVPVWNSGAAPFSRTTQYTALGFSNPLRVVFAKLLLPIREAHAPPGWLLFEGTYVSASRLLLDEYVYDPLVRFGLWANGYARRLQSGSISLYLLYLLVGLTLVLIFVPLVG